MQGPSTQSVPTSMQGTPPGTILPPAYIESVARMAYLWGWPLVNNLNRALGMKDVPEPGRISMLTDYIDSAERLVTCPNQDTVYGAGFQHLDAIPVIVQVPDFGDRFFAYQVCDARTDAFAQIGKKYGNKPGFY